MSWRARSEQNGAALVRFCTVNLRSFIDDLVDPLSAYRHEPSTGSLRVRMDITNKCNLLCKMCFYPGTVGQPKFDMEPDLFRKIVNQVFCYASTVSLACQYEPLMSRHFDEILEIVAEGPCSRVGFVTNGTLLTHRRCELLAKNPHIESIAVSIDGATKATYERIRINGRWEKLVENLETLAAVKAEHKTPRPYVQLNMVLMKSTIAELPQLVDFAKRVNAVVIEAIRYLPMNPGLDEAIDDWQSVMPILIEAKRRAYEYGVYLMLPVHDDRLDAYELPPFEGADTSHDTGEYSCFCEAPWRAVQIYPNGDLHPCGYFGKAFGNLREQEFLEIWNSRPYLQLRRSLKRLRLQRPCAACNPHGYDNIERKRQINIL
ncbi:MAG: radical SAM protein [Candidatus Sumerlaeaceae bacterium]|nr:radical SAM protein [Candidatus Sumerlaeaceae bacterium]